MATFIAEEFRNILNKIDEVGNSPIDENESQKVWTLNTGHGEQIANVAKDPKRHRDAKVVQMKMAPNGAPQLIVMLDDHQYHADWNPQFGWVVDFD